MVDEVVFGLRAAPRKTIGRDAAMRRGFCATAHGRRVGLHANGFTI